MTPAIRPAPAGCAGAAPAAAGRSPMRRGRPRLDVAARRQRILTAAAELFFVRGYDGTTLDAVSKAAGVTKQAVYDLVGDKLALFQAVCKHTFADRDTFRPPVPDRLENLRPSLEAIAPQIDRPLAVRRYPQRGAGDGHRRHPLSRARARRDRCGAAPDQRYPGALFRGTEPLPLHRGDRCPGRRRRLLRSGGRRAGASARRWVTRNRCPTRRRSPGGSRCSSPAIWRPARYPVARTG